MPCLLALEVISLRFCPAAHKLPFMGRKACLLFYSHHFLSSLEKRASLSTDVLKFRAWEYGARTHVSAGLGLSVSDLCFWLLVM